MPPISLLLPPVHRGRPGRRHKFRSQAGFTIVEILAGITIIGVIAAMGVARYSAFQKGRQLDAEARAFTATLARARSLVLKKDMPHLIVLDGEGYALYEDRDRDRTADDGEQVSGHRLPRAVAFGAPASGAESGPNGAGQPALRVEGAWSGNLYLDADRMASLNDGSIYLSVPGLQDRAVCIRKSPGSRQAEIWRWDGTLWSPM